MNLQKEKLNDAMPCPNTRAQRESYKKHDLKSFLQDLGNRS
jgi:hypothetical protein